MHIIWNREKKIVWNPEEKNTSIEHPIPLIEQLYSSKLQKLLWEYYRVSPNGGQKTWLMQRVDFSTSVLTIVRLYPQAFGTDYFDSYIELLFIWFW